jgi:CubicO group peptidase (beta-lactamase class C family)
MHRQLAQLRSPLSSNRWTAVRWAVVLGALAALAIPAIASGQAAVAAGADAKAALPWAKPSEVGIDPAGLEQLDAAMHELVDQGQLAGVQVAVARRGKLVHFDTYGKRDLASDAPLQDDTIFRIYSMTKPIAGVALMTLYDEGRFQLDDPVSKYLPQLGGLQVAVEDGPDGNPKTEPAARDMTIRELMSHSGGFTYGLFGRAQVDILYQKANILDREQNLEQFVDKLAKLPLLYQPGTRWVYSVSVDVQGRLVEVLSGKPFDQYLEERVFAPLGMKDTGFSVPPEDAGRLATLYVPANDGVLQPQTNDDVLIPPKFFSGGGGLVSTAHDYLRFAQMLVNGGELDGKRILKPETVALMMQNHLPEGVGGVERIAPGNRFGLDFAIVTAPNEATDHPRMKDEAWWFGIGGTWFGVHPKEELIVLGMIQLRGGRAPFIARSTSKRLTYAALTER